MGQIRYLARWRKRHLNQALILLGLVMCRLVVFVLIVQVFVLYLVEPRFGLSVPGTK